jgi:hypothetical protein
MPADDGREPASAKGSIRKPIVILGAPRSGTSLLASVIGAHPDVAVVGEPRLVWRYGNDTRSDELGPEHATPAVVRHIHRSFELALAREGASRLVEKTPANAVRPRFVDAVFPDARFVHITRNGWAAIPSMQAFWERRGKGLDAKQVAKLRRRLQEARPSQMRFYAAELLRRVAPGRHVPLYGPRLAGLQEVADEHGRLVASAMQWRTCVDRTAVFGRSLPPGRYMELHVESLRPEDIGQIIDFCGLPECSDVLERFRLEYRVEAATRQRQLNDDERTLVAPYVLPTNAWLGYEEPSVPRSAHSSAR